MMTVQVPEKKRDKKAASKVKVPHQVVHESMSVGFYLSFAMDSNVLEDEAEKPVMTRHDNPFRDVFVPAKAMKGTLKMFDEMQAKLQDVNSGFKRLPFDNCMSCWHRISFPDDTQENYDHYRFCVLMKYEQIMYSKGKKLLCETCDQPLPLGKKRKFPVRAVVAPAINC
jgi:hypothetical protein